jgi:hypothetical protein
MAARAPRKEGKRKREITRRQFLQASGVSALATLMAGLPRGWIGGVYAGEGPETPKVRFGIIALTDCSSIVMAHELGLFKKYGIESTVSKEASWAVIRDRLALGENQATHMLYGMPYASTMGLRGSPQKPMIIPFAINHNGQGITLHVKYLKLGIKKPEQLKPLVEEARKKGQPLTFAMTFPSGTHAMWMRYWLGAGGINPDKDIALITIPPPQMVANLKVDKMDGLCVGEPWNARAFALEPQVLLLDEPFSLLDALTRMELQDELMRLWQEERKTVLMVTHDVDEALLLADRIVMMTSGPAATVGEVLTVPFSRPRSRVAVLGHPDYYKLRDGLISFLENR